MGNMRFLWSRDYLRKNLRPVLTLSAALLLFAGCSDFFVDANQVASIALSPTNATIQPGKTQQFTATATMGDSTTRDVTSQSTWTSSSTTVATIDNSGVATGVAPGTTTITVSNGGVTASTTLLVSTQVVNSITIAPANPTLSVGQTQQFSATATFSDNTTGNVTNSVTWTSSNPGVATVTSAGLVTAVGAGNTTITATSGTVTGTTTVTAF